MNNIIKLIGIGGGLLGLNVLINKLFDEDDSKTNSSNGSKAVPNGSGTIKQTDQTVQHEPLNEEPIHIHREENEPLESPMYTYTEQSEQLNSRSEISKYMSELGKKSGEVRRKKKDHID